MLVSEFDFYLPEDRIALRPVEPRELARLLRVDETAKISDSHIGSIASFLRPGDVLVVNDTKVMPTQLDGERIRANNCVGVEATLIKSLDAVRWKAFLKPGRKVRPGDTLRFKSESCELLADVSEKEPSGQYTLDFLHSPQEFLRRLHMIGGMPLPPYIRSKRHEDEQDKTDYQTIFAKDEGSVAAPTAGLHFTSALLKDLSNKGIGIERITLHVGAGTFLPIKVADTRDHVMHAEFGAISSSSAARINACRADGGRVICVGTTSLRLLESACDEQGKISEFAGETSIFITPGVKVRSCDMLLTNFHLPKSTLFMLVCAFSGSETMKRAYEHAVEAHYRFFSYGDACLLSNLS